MINPNTLAKTPFYLFLVITFNSLRNSLAVTISIPSYFRILRRSESPVTINLASPSMAATRYLSSVGSSATIDKESFSGATNARTSRSSKKRSISLGLFFGF